MNTRYAAVVLAGGFSTRMKQFKPLLPLDKENITSHVIGTFLNADVDVILVTGYRHQEVAAALDERDINIVYNPDYALGMLSSVQAGVRHLHPSHQAFLVLPVDIPLVRPATIRHLMAFSVKNQGKLIYPVFRGKRGHPPLIPSRLASDILEYTKNGGLKAILSSLDGLALDVPVADSFILFDIDTPDDYRRQNPG